MGTAAIVGGGIGGLATAAGLARKGWEVAVYEQAPEFGEVGAAIAVWANGLAALDALDLGDAVRAAGARPGRGGFRTRSGRWLTRGAEDDELVMIHRADLLAILRSAVPAGSLLAGRRIETVPVEDGTPVVDGKPVDLLVGADGLRSRVRALFWPDAPAPRYSGYTAWRAMVPHDGIPRFDGSETWGDGLIFGAFTMGDRIYCYAAARAPEHATSADELADLRRRFAGFADPIPAILAGADPAAVLRHDLYYQPDLPSFVAGRAVLVGDAAHAMTANLGQGGCQALEDAATLVAYADRPDGLASYDAERRPRAQTIVRRSRQVGGLAHLRFPPAAALRNLLVAATPPRVARKQLQAIAGWRPPA